MALDFPRRLAPVALAIALALPAASCRNLAQRLPPYSQRVLATGPATAIAAAPDGSWFVAGAGQSWRIAADGATASWDLPWARAGVRGVSQVAQIAISATGRIAIADPVASLVWDAGSAMAATASSLSILAGTGTGFYPIGEGDLAVSAQIDRPRGVAWDAAGELFVADTGHNRVRKVALDDRIFTVAGRGFPEPLGDDGAATAAGLWSPGALAASKDGEVVIADVDHGRIRTVSNGVIRTLAPERASGLAMDDRGTVFATHGREVNGWMDGDQTVIAVGLHAPAGIAANPRGQVAVADGDRVVLLTPGP